MKAPALLSIFLCLAAIHGRAATPDAGSPDALRMAIEDLSKSFGDRYPDGPQFLARLAALGPKADPAALGQLRREALLANPLLDFEKLLLVRRSGKSPKLGLPQNWVGNCSLAAKQGASG